MAKEQGIRTNLAPFLWLVVNVLLVGLAVGIERTVVPLLGKDVYHIGAWPTVLYRILGKFD